MKATLSLCVSALVLASTIATHAAPKAEIKTLKDWKAAMLDPNFTIQGEYRSDEPAVGLQVIALGEGRFDAVVHQGGLPGAGATPGQARVVLKGTLVGDTLTFVDDAGKTKATGSDKGGPITLIDDLANRILLKKTRRESPTLGAEPPENAIVLFDGTSADQWENGKAENGHLLATNCTTKQTFGSYTLHLEFCTPFMPAAEGQGRGNSGVYHSGRWETQILDSFGLTGEANECGGIYSIAKPALNMCLPPLSWQTYDVDFTAATFDNSGKRTAWPRITVRLNGVVIHDDLELTRDFTAAAPIGKPLTDPKGPIFLQNHGNPVVFKNIWIIPKS